MLNPIKAVSKFYNRLRGKSKKEYEDLNAFYNIYQRQLLIITTTAHNLFEHISANFLMKGFSKEQVTKNLMEFERLTNSFVELSKGERFQINELGKSEEEEVAELETMMKALSQSAPAAANALMARANEILNLENEEKQLYRNAATAVTEKANAAARLHELLSNPEKNSDEIRQRWKQFEQATNELATQLKNLVAIEKKILSKEDALEKAA